MEQNNDNNKTPLSPDGASDKNTLSASSDNIKPPAAAASTPPEVPAIPAPVAPPPAAPTPPPPPPPPPPATASGAKDKEPPQEAAPPKKGKGKTKRTKKYWKRRLRRRRRRRRVRRFFFFLFALLLGIVVAYGSLFLAAYFAIGGLTIDTLQRFGIAKGADQYLTENGDVDLTDMSLLELLADLQSVRDDLSSYTLSTLIQHYGLVLPENVQRIMPTDLYDVPLNQLFSDQAGTAVAENLTMGYILSFMPGSMLNPRVIETISPRPLSLLTNGDFGALFADVQMGYLTGVTYDEGGAVVYLDPAVPTFQEVTAELDLGDLLGAMTENGDLLKVIAENIGDAPAGPFVKGITEGAMIDDVASDMTVADLVVLNESTGRYEFSFKNLTANALLGKTMGYTLVDGVWYSAYTENGDSSDDVRVTGINAALADLSLGAIIENQLSLTDAFADLFIGDLQAGYERGDAIYGTPEGDEEPPVIGYKWLKDGASVGEMQQALADIPLTDLLEGNLDLTAALGDVLIGDAAGYQRGDEIPNADPNAPKRYQFTKTDNAPVEGVMLEISNYSLSDLLNGTADLEGAVKGMTIAEVMEFTLVDGVYYSTYIAANDLGNVRVTGVLAALADEKISGLNQTTVDAISVGEILGFTQNGSEWRDENNAPVTGISAKLAECTVGMLSDPDAIGTKLRELTLAEAMGYKKGVDGIYYDKNNAPITGILAELAETPLDSIHSATIDGILVGKVMGYQQLEGEWYQSDGTTPVEGLLLAFVDLKVGDLSNAQRVTAAIHKITLGDALGYTKKADGHWYHVVEGEETLVRGLLAVLADSTVGEVDLDINTIPLGTILNYHKAQDEGDGQWYWYDEENVKQTGIAALLADETLDTLAPRLKALTIDDLMPNRKDNVLLKSIDGTKPFSELESECQKALKNATMGQLAEAGVLSEDNQNAMDSLGVAGWWKTLTVDEFLTEILEFAEPNP